jgi:hypothetical protein
MYLAATFSACWRDCHVSGHEHLVEVPAPLARLQTFDATFADLGGERRTEPLTP